MLPYILKLKRLKGIPLFIFKIHLNMNVAFMLLLTIIT